MKRIFVICIFGFFCATAFAQDPQIMDPGAELSIDEGQPILTPEVQNPPEQQVIPTGKIASPEPETKEAGRAEVIASTKNDQEDVEVEDVEPVEIVMKENPALPYRERRLGHGWTLGFRQENVYLSKYQTIAPKTSGGKDFYDYKDIYGTESVQLPTLHVGYKFNMPLGSLGVEGSIGQFSLSDNLSATTYELQVTRYSVGLVYTADTLFSEPWIAPYFGGHLYQMAISEDTLKPDNVTTNTSGSTTTSPGTMLTAGILIQLNAADKDAANTALRTYGLENTFLDLFMTEYMASGGDESEPDTSSDFHFGVGIKFEF